MVAALLVSGVGVTLSALFLLWEKLPEGPNYRGKPTPTATGIALVPAVLVALLAPGDVFYPLYVLLCAGVGFADDVWGGLEERGFGGHLGALLWGRVSTGFVKLAVLGGGALVVGFAEFGWIGIFGGLLLAGCVNLANLLDVRPGRAVKFTGPFIVVLAFASAGGVVIQMSAVIGGMASLFYFDLRGSIMLGDAGAAVLGAVLGALLLSLGPGVAWVAGGFVVVGLTVVAEVSSISKLIHRVGSLRAYDLLGRDRLD